MKPVEIVKISKIIPIYKNGEIANAIEVAKIEDFSGNSSEFNIVVRKGLYKVGDKVIYIQPDYCIPDNEYFSEYHRPDGDSSKSKLGKKGRIRAIKFNLSFEGSNEPIYSNGIIMPLSAFSHIENIENIDDLQSVLNITKYEAEDSFEKTVHSGLNTEFPSFLYKTDEPRIENLKSYVNELASKFTYIGATIKRDGSSITIFVRKSINGEWVKGICSRTLQKKLEQKVVDHYKTNEGAILKRYYNKEKI